MRYEEIKEISKKDFDIIIEVQKYNPYHGADGRFTSAGGSITMAAGSAPGNNASSGSGAVSGVGSGNFTPAKTVQEAREYAKTQLGFSGYVDYSYSYIDQVTLRQESGTLDIDTVNHINKTITEIQTRYPELKGYAKNLECTTSNVYAQAFISGRDGSCSLQIGAKAYKDGVQSVYDSWKGDVDIGYHPKGTDGGAVLWHEYGHVYAAKANGTTSAIRNKDAETGWKNEAAKKLNVDADTISKNVSRYATNGADELFAEAFAAHNTGHGTKWTDAIIEAASADRR